MRLSRLLPSIGLAVTSVSVYAVSARSSGGTLHVNEMPVWTYRTGAASSRAAAAASALRSISSSGEVRVKALRSSHRIHVGGRLVATISAAEASAQGGSRAWVASLWASSLRKALALPPLWLESQQVRLGVGGSTTVKLYGSAAARAAVSIPNSGLLKAELRPGALFVRAIDLGDASVVVRSGQSQLALKVSVLPAASAFPQSLAAWTSGLPASESAVRGSVETAIATQLKRYPGTSVTVDFPTIGSLAMGSATSVAVRVKVTGEGCFPAEGVANVTVRNEPLPRIRDAHLWYSNHPENLKGPGALFAADLEPESPARLLYHHINQAPFGMVLQTQILNESNRSARLFVIPGDAQPDKNPVLAGTRAADQFLRGWLQLSGEIVEIPPRSRMLLSFRRLSPQETGSGLCLLRLLRGGPEKVSVRVDARPSFGASGTWLRALQSPTPWRVLGLLPLAPDSVSERVASNHVYPDPFRAEEVAYQVGGKYGFVRIGQAAIPRADGEASLSGNFGVLYSIRATMENPSEKAADVEIAFESSAGYTGALFVVNGRLMPPTFLQPKGEISLVKARLEPGEKREYLLLTLPMSGSSYPATLSVRPVTAPLSFGSDVRGVLP